MVGKHRFEGSCHIVARAIRPRHPGRDGAGEHGPVRLSGEVPSVATRGVPAALPTDVGLVLWRQGGGLAPLGGFGVGVVPPADVLSAGFEHNHGHAQGVLLLVCIHQLLSTLSLLPQLLGLRLLQGLCQPLPFLLQVLAPLYVRVCRDGQSELDAGRGAALLVILNQHLPPVGDPVGAADLVGGDPVHHARDGAFLILVHFGDDPPLSL
mmetsp:Transcript_24986/g.63395  ORF Transcript_24986/g.63395 Transcript_24986/m.63395 type:complete len:209 (-) Transcript_24986:279-905(-)